MATKMGARGNTGQSNTSDEAISQQVVEAVADAKGVDPLDLPPLYNTVDPDALDSLFSHAESHSAIAELRFTIEGCEVLIRGSGEVVVTTGEDEPATTDAESQTDSDIRRDLAEDRCGIELGAKGQVSPHHT